ncbi:MAG: xanthine dehydrogenase family protein subunit M [Deltaproteobacteria bacterium]|nr:xanthine dehydrogenase family protein subunit M [Deltaproteobacteria bacterium]
MKPASFHYYRARSLQEALDLLSGAAANGKLLAGGQSLIPLMNLRLARPEALIDLNSIPGLSYIRSEGNKIAIGALTRHREMEFSELLAKELPLLAEAIPQIGHPAIRNRGTLGGSLAHADPAAELPCVLTALDARMVAAGPDGERVIRAEDFFTGFYATALADHEILKEVRIPLEKRAAGWSFVEFARRHGDFALAEASVLLFADGAGDRCTAGDGCTAARVVVGGSVERPVRVGGVEKLIQGEISLNTQASSLAHVLQRVEQLTETEIRSSIAGRENPDYLCHLTGVLARRALESAMERWRKA